MEVNKKALMQDAGIVNQFKEELIKLERLVRVFEMTYLDLKDNLQSALRTANLGC